MEHLGEKAGSYSAENLFLNNSEEFVIRNLMKHHDGLGMGWFTITFDECVEFSAIGIWTADLPNEKHPNHVQIFKAVPTTND